MGRCQQNGLSTASARTVINVKLGIFIHASISFRSMPGVSHILDSENIFAIIYSRNTAFAGL
jgi:hypothetical protein